MVFATRERFFVLNFCWSILINMLEWVKQQKRFRLQRATQTSCYLSKRETCRMFWKNPCLYVYKVSYCDKCCTFHLVLSVIFIERQNERQKKISRQHNCLGAITLFGTVRGERCPGVICPGEIHRGYCLRAISWGQFFRWELSRG